MFLPGKIYKPVILLFSAGCFVLLFSFFSKPVKWTTVKNMEQIKYCLSLPLEGYKENFKKNDVRAKHVFTHKTKKDNEITVQGMFRTESQTAEEYYNKYFEVAEEEGIAIEARRLDKANNRFYVRGYMSNDYYKSRFIEVFWLRKDELVKLTADFRVNDSLFWYKNLDLIFKQTANCTK